MRHELQEQAAGVSLHEMGWVSRVQQLIDELPLPAPVWYVAAALVAIGLFVLNDWLALGRPMEAMQPFHVVLALDPIYAFALMHLLDKSAGRALQRMRRLLIKPDAFDQLHLQLTALPAREALLGSLAGLAVGLVAIAVERLSLPAVFRPFLPALSARLFVEVWLVMTWCIFGALFVHTVHQLRAINRIYTHETVIDLDNYQPLFHFSRVSAATAIGLLVIPYAWSLGVPNLLRDPIATAFAALFPIFALLAFLWPLLGVHNLMVEAKGRALFENSGVLKDVRSRLFEHAASGALGGADELHDALEAIRAEREALLHVPTWPWQPGTPRSVAVALLLPVIIWFLQWGLQKVFGG